MVYLRNRSVNIYCLCITKLELGNILKLSGDFWGREIKIDQLNVSSVPMMDLFRTKSLILNGELLARVYQVIRQVGFVYVMVKRRLFI